MPTVKRYQRQNVTETASTDQNFNVNVSAETFGKGAADVPAQGISKFAELYNKEVNAANELKAVEKQNQLKSLVNDVMYNPETGLTYTKGRDALEASKKSRELIQPKIDELMKDLSPAQQKYFQPYAGSTLSAMDKQLNKHQAVQKRIYDNQQTDAFVQNERNAAAMNFADTEFVENSIAMQQDAIVKKADREGTSPDAIKLDLITANSSTRTKVIEQYIDSDNSKTAKAYLDQHKNNMLPDDVKRLKGLLKEGLDIQDYQDTADSIIGKASNQVDALNRANSIEDAEKRAEVKKLVKSNYTEVDNAERQFKEDLYLRATNLVEQNPNRPAREVIPASQWTKFSISERKALEGYAANGSPQKSDLAVYYDLETMASNPKTMKSFMTMNMLEVKHKLSESDFKEMSALQMKLRKGKQSEELDGISTKKSIVDNALNAAGIEYGKGKDKEVNERANNFRRSIDELVVQKQKELGRKINNDELRKLTEAQMSEFVIKESRIPIFGSDTKKRAFELEVDDVPVDLKNTIRDALTNKGIPTTDANILRIYRARLANEKAK